MKEHLEMRLTKFVSSLFAGLLLMSMGLSSAQAEGNGNIAVMRFTGPQVVDVDADEIWKIKTKVDPPTKGELTKLTVDLQKGIIQQLRELVGKSVLPKSDLDKALSKSTPEAGANQTDKLAKDLGAKYLVTGTIDRVEFDGNTIMKDKYVLIVTTKLVDAKSGKRIWQQAGKKFMIKAFTRKTGGTVYDLFAKKQIPDVATTLASDIASAMGR